MACSVGGDPRVQAALYCNDSKHAYSACGAYDMRAAAILVDDDL